MVGENLVHPDSADAEHVEGGRHVVALAVILFAAFPHIVVKWAAGWRDVQVKRVV